jgi:hypothetical protein
VRLACRSLFFALALAVLPSALAGPSTAAAQVQATEDERPPGAYDDEGAAVEDEGPPPIVMPLRILATVGAGATLRIINDLTLVQGRFAPSFLDFAGSVVFPGAGLYRHGATLAISTNLNGEGPAAPADPNADDFGVDPLIQWTFTPSYLAYLRFGEDVVLTGRLGANFTIAPYFVMGGEASVGGTFLFTAGLGVYAEVSANLAFGVSGVTPTVSAEGGVVIDYEVLP